MHYLTLPPWVALTLMTVVCGGALIRGGWEERSTAIALLAAWAATLLLRDPHWNGAQWGALAVDVALLSFLGFVALRSTRFWPLFAAGFHLLGVVTHAARMMDPTLGAWAYATAAVVWSQLVIVALGVGTWNRWRERRQLAKAGLAAAPGATRL